MVLSRLVLTEEAASLRSLSGLAEQSTAAGRVGSRAPKQPTRFLLGLLIVLTEPGEKPSRRLVLGLVLLILTKETATGVSGGVGRSSKKAARGVRSWLSRAKSRGRSGLILLSEQEIGRASCRERVF